MSFTIEHPTAIASRVLPVLDLLGGQVVRGVAGDRARYRPITTPLATGSDPVEIAKAIREHYQFISFYIADLDGIQQGQPDRATIAQLVRENLRLSVDAGLRSVDDGKQLVDLGVNRVIAGLETSPGPELLEQLLDHCGPDRVVFSLDLRGGQPLLAPESAWRGMTPWAIARTVVALGVRTLLVLDLAGVGMECGVPTLDFCRRLRQLHPSLEIWTGGGVRSNDDLRSADAAGVDGLLVASALHTGNAAPPIRVLGSTTVDPPTGPNVEDIRSMPEKRLIVCELTPRGRGAVSTVLIQGELSRLEDLPTLFSAANGRPVSEQPLQRICFGHWGTESPEDVVICRVAGDAVEVHCHGGRAAVGRIMDDLSERGAAVESIEEHRQRVQVAVDAECDTALSRAITERTAMLLTEQRDGVLHRKLVELMKSLDQAQAGNGFALSSARDVLSEMLRWSRFGLHLTRPWSVVLCGRPNTGKSSLINALAGFTRSIVSPQPGTTRDVVTVGIVLEGWPIELSDTAGLRLPDDDIESAGVQRAYDRLAAADLKLLLLDVSQPLDADDRQLIEDHPEAIVVAHKCDLPAAWELRDRETLAVSSVTGVGLPDLMRRIVGALVPEIPQTGVPLLVSDELVAALRRTRAVLVDDDATSARSILGRMLMRSDQLESRNACGGGVRSSSP